MRCSVTTSSSSLQAESTFWLGFKTAACTCRSLLSISCFASASGSSTAAACTHVRTRRWMRQRKPCCVSVAWTTTVQPLTHTILRVPATFGVYHYLDLATAAAGLYCERAQLKDGQAVLELGCGWGSLCLYLAERYPRSEITAVSNSKTQKELIMQRAKDRRLTNLKVSCQSGHVRQYMLGPAPNNTPRPDSR